MYSVVLSLCDVIVRILQSLTTIVEFVLMHMGQRFEGKQAWVLKRRHKRN